MVTVLDDETVSIEESAVQEPQAAPVELACAVQQSAPGVWRCGTHQEGLPMGSPLPCQIPLGEEARQALAKTPSLNPTTAWLLAGDVSPDVRTMVAFNPSTPVPVLELLLQDPGSRLMVASNHGAPAVLLDRLASDGDRVMRGAVANNPNVPAPTLERLAKDPIERVRQCVAGAPHAPAALLERLAQDPADAVRHLVAANPHTPTPVLRRLADDPDPLVQWTAVRRLPPRQ